MSQQLVCFCRVGVDADKRSRLVVFEFVDKGVEQVEVNSIAFEMKVLAALAVRTEAGQFEVSADFGFVELIGNQLGAHFGVAVRETAVVAEFALFRLLEVLADFSFVLVAELKLRRVNRLRFVVVCLRVSFDFTFAALRFRMNCQSCRRMQLSKSVNQNRAFGLSTDRESSAACRSARTLSYLHF